MMPQAFGQLGDAAESAWQAVQADLKAKMTEFNSQPGVVDGLKGFAAAVDWTEPWIGYLLTFHVFLLTAAVLKRRSQAVTATIFFLAMALVYNAERINTLAGRHWQQFARQNYFDGNGVFAGVLLGAPLLTIMFVILLIYLQQMAALLVRMKRTELRVKAKRRAAGAARDVEPAGGNGTSSESGTGTGLAAAGPKLD
jgi:uncharacterized membrane protein